MVILQRDIPIILALIENPTGTDNEIMEKVNSNLTNDDELELYSLTTIHRRIKKLEAKNIVQGATAIIDYSKLGLVMYSFIIVLSQEQISEAILIFEKFCDEHPYTNYLNRIYGAENGIYCKFNLPKGEKPLAYLLEGFNVLKRHKIILSFEQLPIMRSLVVHSGNLENWTSATNSWKFNFSKLNDMFDVPPNAIPSPIEIMTVDFAKFQMIDMAIIREMTRNARRSQIDILEQILDNTSIIGNDYSKERELFPKSKQSFSRRIKFLLKHHVFLGFQLFYQRTEFGMFNQVQYVGKYDQKSISNLYNAIKSGGIPFPCELSISETDFVFWINIPPIEMIEFTDILYKHFKNIRIYLLGRIPKKYYFWHKNYDSTEKNWKTTRDWMINKPIKTLGL